MHALHGKLLLVAGHAKVVVLLWDEALGANRLLASLAREAGLVPAVPLMLHLPGAFETHDKSKDYYLLNPQLLFTLEHVVK